MTKERASELITENLTAIYGFAFGRLYEKDKVEDLASEIVCDCMLQISEQAEKLLTEHAPAAVRSQCGDVAKIHHRLNVAAFLLEKLIEDKKLTVPAEQTPLAVWGVRA